MSVTWCHLAIICFLTAVTIDANSLSKRRLDELGGMIHDMTGRDSLDFNGYGSYCGIGGSGTPVDNIDRCCQTHDGCYHDVNRNQCAAAIKLKPYVEGYNWQFNDGKITCSSDDDSCRRATCNCDKALAECLRQHKDEYNRDNVDALGKVISGIQHLFGSR